MNAMTEADDTMDADTFVRKISEAEPYLRSVLSSFTKDAHEQSDLLQRVYAKAWEKRDYYELGTNFPAWLSTLGRNLAINRWRRNSKKQEKLREEPEAIEHLSLADPPESPDARVVHGQWSARVVEALEELKPEFRSVLLLRELHDFSYREIAYICDAPVGTIMSRLHRARKKFRKILPEDLRPVSSR